MMAAGDRTLKEISRQLDVSVVSLIKWRRAFEMHPVLSGTGPKAGEKLEPMNTMTEVERLRLELASVTEERDRLRKSLALLIGAM